MTRVVACNGCNCDDANGNITFDPLRSFEIQYNLLNLASGVTGLDPDDLAAEGVPLSETVYYADGTRAGVRNPDNGSWTTRYVGSLIYNGEQAEESLDGVVTADGYIDCGSGGSNARMQYFLRDHLGSVRVIAEDRNTVLSRTDYHPFGVRMTGTGLPESPTERSAWFGFTGKENELWGGPGVTAASARPHWLRGERYQHFGARAYDPFTCTFMQVDPLAEKYYGISPYAYCAGDPVRYVDRDGGVIETAWDIANVVAGVASFAANVAAGNVGGAIVDAVGIVADAASVVAPGIPGGASAGIKAIRAGKLADKAIDAARAAEHASDAVKAGDKTIDAAKASRMEKLREKATIGQEAHRQIEKYLKEEFGAHPERAIIVNNGKGGKIKIRKDAEMPDGTYVIIKPDTPSGHAAAAKREKLMRDNHKDTKTIYYNPFDPAYQPGSLTYIGPPKK